MLTRYNKSAIRGLRRIPRAEAADLRAAIDLYAEDPESEMVDATPLIGRAGHRIRVDAYRAIVTVSDGVVTVLRAGHRRDVYK